MYTFAEKLRIAGICVTLAGLLCFPFLGESPKRALSVFTELADMGLMIKLGIGTVGVGVLLFAASFLFRGQ